MPAPFGEGPAIIHMDLHPANVLLSAAGPVVIDWAAASRGAPEADVAQAWIIMATSVIPASAWRRRVGALLRDAFVREFHRPFDRPAVAALLPAVAARRIEDPHVFDPERNNIQRLLRRETGGRAAS